MHRSSHAWRPLSGARAPFARALPAAAGATLALTAALALPATSWAAPLSDASSALATLATPLRTADLAPATLSAPAGTAEIWIDIEGANAGTSVTELSSRSAGTWSDSPAIVTPFGASAAFTGAPGAHDIRVRLSPTLTATHTADIAVTYADTDGAILAETTVRDARLTPGLADDDGWINWAAIAEATNDAGDGGGGNDDGTGGGNGGGAAAPGAAARDDASLSRTGAPSSLWISLGAAAALGVGAATVVAARRSAARRSKATMGGDA